MELQKDLNAITLAHGSHTSPGDGLCLMEAVAYWAGERHTDHPACACPVLTSYGISLNDNFPQAKRQELKKFIPLLVGTRNPDLEQRRAYFLLDKAVRVFTPITLRHAAKALIAAKSNLDVHAVILEDEAEKLETLPVIDSRSAAEAAEAAARSAEAAEAAARSAKSAEAAEAAEAAARSAKSARSAGYAAEAAEAAGYAAEAAEAAARSAEYAAVSARSAESAARSAANEIHNIAIATFGEALAIGIESAVA